VVDAEEVDAEVLPNGKLYTAIYKGDWRKATAKLWGKKVEKVDTTKEGGYAFEGDWLNTDYEGRYQIELAEGEMAVCLVQTGSWRHKGQHMYIFFVKNGKMFNVTLPYNSRADKVKAVHTASEILEEIRGKNPKEQQAKALIQKAIELVGVEGVLRILEEGENHEDGSVLE